MTFKYVELSFQDYGARTENCDGEKPGSPGIDCNGPSDSISIAPMVNGAPMYLSRPFFDKIPGVDSGLKSYSPGDRVSITRCTDSKWCDEQKAGNQDTYLWIEPETGFLVKVQST